MNFKNNVKPFGIIVCSIFTLFFFTAADGHCMNYKSWSDGKTRTYGGSSASGSNSNNAPTSGISTSKTGTTSGSSQGGSSVTSQGGKGSGGGSGSGNNNTGLNPLVDTSSSPTPTPADPGQNLTSWPATSSDYPFNPDGSPKSTTVSQDNTTNAGYGWPYPPGVTPTPAPTAPPPTTNDILGPSGSGGTSGAGDVTPPPGVVTPPPMPTPSGTPTPLPTAPPSSFGSDQATAWNNALEASKKTLAGQGLDWRDAIFFGSHIRLIDSSGMTYCGGGTRKVVDALWRQNPGTMGLGGDPGDFNVMWFTGAGASSAQLNSNCYKGPYAFTKNTILLPGSVLIYKALNGNQPDWTAQYGHAEMVLPVESGSGYILCPLTPTTPLNAFNGSGYPNWCSWYTWTHTVWPLPHFASDFDPQHNPHFFNSYIFYPNYGYDKPTIQGGHGVGVGTGGSYNYDTALNNGTGYTYDPFANKPMLANDNPSGIAPATTAPIVGPVGDFIQNDDKTPLNQLIIHIASRLASLDDNQNQMYVDTSGHLTTSNTGKPCTGRNPYNGDNAPTLNNANGGQFDDTFYSPGVLLPIMFGSFPNTDSVSNAVEWKPYPVDLPAWTQYQYNVPKKWFCNGFCWYVAMVAMDMRGVLSQQGWDVGHIQKFKWTWSHDGMANCPIDAAFQFAGLSYTLNPPSIQPGDFINLDWVGGGGHTVIALENNNYSGVLKFIATSNTGPIGVYSVNLDTAVKAIHVYRLNEFPSAWKQETYKNTTIPWNDPNGVATQKTIQIKRYWLNFAPPNSFDTTDKVDSTNMSTTTGKKVGTSLDSPTTDIFW